MRGADLAGALQPFAIPIPRHRLLPSSSCPTLFPHLFKPRTSLLLISTTAPAKSSTCPAPVHLGFPSGLSPLDPLRSLLHSCASEKPVSRPRQEPCGPCAPLSHPPLPHLRGSPGEGVPGGPQTPPPSALVPQPPSEGLLPCTATPGRASGP